MCRSGSIASQVGVPSPCFSDRLTPERSWGYAFILREGGFFSRVSMGCTLGGLGFRV